MEREVLEFDVQFIGAGPAGLAGAIHLSNLIERHNAAGAGTPIPETTLAVLEKSARVGAHGLSGLVLDPRALSELMPDFRDQGCPVASEVTSDDVYMMWDSGQLRLPIVPPMLQNHGNLIASLGALTEWMAGIAESKGVLIATETPAASPLLEDQRVVGVRTGDKGIDKHGEKKATYQPGADCRAKLTVLCEGPRGTVAKALEPRLGLTEGKNPQVYATGVKELWEVPPGRVQKGRVIHTMGWPLPNDTFGGGFIYGFDDTHWAIGFVTGLDYRDPTTDPHRNLQRYKTHPLVRPLIEGGKLVSYGAKAIPEGGYWAMPKLSADGVLLCGDSGGFLNGARLKGVHLAIKSGMLAAETIYRQLKAGSSDFSDYETAVYDSHIGKDLYESRNMKQPFAKGLVVGGAIVNAMTVTKGKLPGGHWPTHRDAEQPLLMTGRAKRYPKPDGKYTFDKLSGVFLTGNATRDDAPSHIRVEKNVPARSPRRGRGCAPPASTRCRRTRRRTATST